MEEAVHKGDTGNRPRLFAAQLLPSLKIGLLCFALLRCGPEQLPVTVAHGTGRERENSESERLRGRKDGYSAGRPARVGRARGLRDWKREEGERDDGDERISIGLNSG